MFPNYLKFLELSGCVLVSPEFPEIFVRLLEVCWSENFLFNLRPSLNIPKLPQSFLHLYWILIDLSWSFHYFFWKSWNFLKYSKLSWCPRNFFKLSEASLKWIKLFHDIPRTSQFSLQFSVHFHETNGITMFPQCLKLCWSLRSFN